MKYGFVKVAAAIPLVKVADCQFNAQQTSKLIVEADSKGVQVIIFPELNLIQFSDFYLHLLIYILLVYLILNIYFF